MWLPAALIAIVSFLGAAVDAIREAATIDREAHRDIAHDPTATCDLDTVAAVSARHPHARQLVLMTTSSFGDTTGSVEVAARDDAGTWRCQRGPQEAALDLAAGRPRFYVMRLERRGRSFSTIARHCHVTQCLASAGGRRIRVRS